MRPRTFILLILVLLVAAVLVVVLVAGNSGGLAGLFGGGGNAEAPAGETGDSTGVTAEPGLPPPSPTPAFVDVVVARVQIPLGETITEELLEVQQRPVTNVALQGGYTFTDTTEVAGQISRVTIARGQEILAPMLALDPTDVANFGSDLSMYVPFGEVAVALPIDPFSGAALAMRPGDLVDVMMTLQIFEIDPTFRSRLPNVVRRVSELQLQNNNPFLFPPIEEGRLEFVPEINQVAAIIPGGASDLSALTDPFAVPIDMTVPGQSYEPGEVIPKRVTQLTVQQAKVLFVGTWQDPRELERQQEAAQAAAEATAQAGGEGGVPAMTPTPIPSRLEDNPDMIILSMSLQDALALKYARERSVRLDLVLRSPGDNTVFVTTSVSLPQIIEQGGLALPEQTDIDLFNELYDVP